MRRAVMAAALALAGCQDAAHHAPPAGRPADAELVDVDEARTNKPGSRRFRFVYDVTIGGLPERATARVWVPLGQSTPDQCVEIEQLQVPDGYRITTESRFGNRLLFFEAEADEAGRIAVRVDYRVERFEVTPETSPRVAESAEHFLEKSVLALPAGEVTPRLLPAQPSAGSNLARGRLLYDAVDALLAYDKSLAGWGRGDVAWACAAGSGNCTDFHSVFIAACQELQIPARFEIGFPVPLGRREGSIEGYHCWARFVHEGRWLAVDISEADKQPERRDAYFGNLPADRVQFSVGRDLVLEPPQQGGPVNFLIYPYVEIEGPAEVELEKRFRFEETDAAVCGG